jgi:hypothetical protein
MLAVFVQRKYAALEIPVRGGSTTYPIGNAFDSSAANGADPFVSADPDRSLMILQ